MSVRSLSLYLEEPTFILEAQVTVTNDLRLDSWSLEMQSLVTLDMDLNAPKTEQPKIVVNM